MTLNPVGIARGRLLLQVVETALREPLRDRPVWLSQHCPEDLQAQAGRLLDFAEQFGADDAPELRRLLQAALAER